MNDQSTELDGPACSNPDCTSGEDPLPGYDDCTTCAWEAFVAREAAKWQARVSALESDLAAAQTLRDTLAALVQLDAVCAEEARTFGQRNAARAERAARRLSLTAADAPVPTGVGGPERAAIVQAMTDLLHYGEGTGAYIDELLAAAVRQHGSDISDEERETRYPAAQLHLTCPRCRRTVGYAKRWYEPCSPCRARLGLRDEGISDDPVEANLQRAHLVEDTLDGFAARTGQAGRLADADRETRAEVLRDFLCNAGHYADETGLDLDQLFLEGRDVYREEHAEAADGTAPNAGSGN